MTTVTDRMKLLLGESASPDVKTNITGSVQRYVQMTRGERADVRVVPKPKVEAFAKLRKAAENAATEEWGEQTPVPPEEVEKKVVSYFKEVTDGLSKLTRSDFRVDRYGEVECSDGAAASYYDFEVEWLSEFEYDGREVRVHGEPTYDHDLDWPSSRVPYVVAPKYVAPVPTKKPRKKKTA